jgi:two-component system OmpR family sensor kinase
VREHRRLLPVALPAALGLLLGLLSSPGPLPNPKLFVRADASLVYGLAGLLLSALIAGGLFVYERERRIREHIADLQKQAADDRRRLLQRLDHELKNPLTAIRAGVANLSEAPAESGEALSSVVAQTVRLSRLAADLRKLGELETRPLEHTAVDTGELLREVVALVRERPEVADRKLTLMLPQAPWPLPHVSGDRDLLFLAMHNLVENAIKFTQPGDTVEVRGYEEREEVVIEVADTGPGIPEDEVPYVWDELSRGQAARSVPGTGLGLALVRAIISRHNGEAAIRSRVGQGTVVTVRLKPE